MTTPVIIDTVLFIDDVFIRLAEASTGTAVPVDDVVEELWSALELGDIRLVVEGSRLHIEPFEGSRAERLRLARAHRPVIEARWRVLDEGAVAGTPCAYTTVKL